MELFLIIAGTLVSIAVGSILTVAEYRMQGVYLKKNPKKAQWSPYVDEYVGPNRDYINIEIRDGVKILFIGTVEIAAEDFTDKYNLYMDIAQDRAEFLNLEQNTYNYK